MPLLSTGLNVCSWLWYLLLSGRLFTNWIGCYPHLFWMSSQFLHLAYWLQSWLHFFGRAWIFKRPWLGGNWCMLPLCVYSSGLGHSCPYLWFPRQRMVGNSLQRSSESSREWFWRISELQMDRFQWCWCDRAVSVDTRSYPSYPLHKLVGKSTKQCRAVSILCNDWMVSKFQLEWLLLHS